MVTVFINEVGEELINWVGISKPVSKAKAIVDKTNILESAGLSSFSLNLSLSLNKYNSKGSCIASKTVTTSTVWLKVNECLTITNNKPSTDTKEERILNTNLGFLSL